MSVQPYADRFELGAHRIFVEASQAAAHGRMFTPFRFIVVNDGQAAFAVALEQNPADRSLFLFAVHDGASVSLAGGGLRHPFDYAAVKAAAIPIIERGIALRMRAHQGLAAPPIEAPWNRQPQQAAPQQWGPAPPVQHQQLQAWPAPAGVPQQAYGHAQAAQPPMHVWGTVVAPQPLFVGGFQEVIFKGAGLLNPRLSGLGYIAVGALCAGGTYAMIHLIGIVFPYAAVLGTTLGLPGLFMLVTGEPKARPGDESHPLLVRVGVVLSFMVGGIGGLFTLQFYM